MNLVVLQLSMVRARNIAGQLLPNLRSYCWVQSFLYVSHNTPHAPFPPCTSYSITSTTHPTAHPLTLRRSHSATVPSLPPVSNRMASRLPPPPTPAPRAPCPGHRVAMQVMPPWRDGMHTTGLLPPGEGLEEEEAVRTSHRRAQEAEQPESSSGPRPRKDRAVVRPQEAAWRERRGHPGGGGNNGGSSGRLSLGEK